MYIYYLYVHLFIIYTYILFSHYFSFYISLGESVSVVTHTSPKIMLERNHRYGGVFREGLSCGRRVSYKLVVYAHAYKGIGALYVFKHVKMKSSYTSILHIF